MLASQLLIATTNPAKLHEIRELLGDLPLELITLAEYPSLHAPEETGRTFADNARLKARYYAAATGRTTVAEDSGLEIDALGGAPGVESARFGGAHLSYPEKFALIYDLLRTERSSADLRQRLGSSTRTSAKAEPGVEAAGRADEHAARFVCALALAEGDRILFEAQGTVEGTIAPEPRGSGGFGYDPIFFYPPFGCTLASAGERKSLVSHRGSAFRHLRSWLISHVLRSSPPP
jgi:XTP/dITP diphosphohydrolase